MSHFGTYCSPITCEQILISRFLQDLQDVNLHLSRAKFIIRVEKTRSLLENIFRFSFFSSVVASMHQGKGNMFAFSAEALSCKWVAWLWQTNWRWKNTQFTVVGLVLSSVNEQNINSDSDRILIITLKRFPFFIFFTFVQSMCVFNQAIHL